jgi:hypothetical protein
VKRQKLVKDTSDEESKSLQITLVVCKSLSTISGDLGRRALSLRVDQNYNDF